MCAEGVVQWRPQLRVAMRATGKQGNTAGCQASKAIIPLNWQSNLPSWRESLRRPVSSFRPLCDCSSGSAQFDFGHQSFHLQSDGPLGEVKTKCLDFPGELLRSTN